MDVVQLYMKTCYNLLGRYLEEMNIEGISNMLYQADMEITAGMFLAQK